MTHVFSRFFRHAPLARALLLALALVGSAAMADDYTDVSQLMRSGKLAEAMTRADQFLATRPRDPQMRFLKGVIQRDTGKLAEAIASFTRLTEDYPELPEPYNNLAVLYAGQNQFDKARAALEMAIRTNPSYATAHENLGDVYARLASQAYNKALQLDGSNTGVPPKMALIRELFNPVVKGQKPLDGLPPGSTAPAAATGTAPAPAPAVPALAPTPTLAPAPAPSAAATAPPAAKAALPVVTMVAPAVKAAAPTPAPTVPAVRVAAPAEGSVKDAEAAVKSWAAAWAAKDMTTYLAAYGVAFQPPGNQSRSVWEAERRKRITGKASIEIKLDNLSVVISGVQAVAKFKQDYRAGGLVVSSRKTLDMVRVADRWVIVKETSGT